MNTFKIVVYVDANGDAGTVTQWVGEALSNGDVRDSDMGIDINSVEVERQ